MTHYLATIPLVNLSQCDIINRDLDIYQFLLER
jgi:hypothetical protein